MNKVALFVDRDHAEDTLIEAQGSLRVAYGKCNVREAVCLHG